MRHSPWYQVRPKGRIRDRAALRIRIRDQGRKSFRLQVRLSAGQEMTWTFRLPLGLFTIVRTFTLTDYTGIAHLAVQDTASGPLHRVLPSSYPAVPGFVAEVKLRAELLSFHLNGGLFPRH